MKKLGYIVLIFCIAPIAANAQLDPSLILQGNPNAFGQAEQQQQQIYQQQQQTQLMQQQIELQRQQLQQQQLQEEQQQLYRNQQMYQQPFKPLPYGRVGQY